MSASVRLATLVAPRGLSRWHVVDDGFDRVRIRLSGLMETIVPSAFPWASEQPDKGSARSAAQTMAQRDRRLGRRVPALRVVAMARAIPARGGLQRILVPLGVTG